MVGPSICISICLSVGWLTENILLISSKQTRPSGKQCVLKHFWAYTLKEMWEMRGENLSTAIATSGGRYAGELFWYFSWLYMPFWSFLFIKLSISCIFYKSVTYRRTNRRTNRGTNGPTDQWTNGPTDGPTDRNALL